jgi:HAD superfamily hydrolase (TIGR01509 family)
MKKALIFDCDGVLADTEPYGHLVAFNRMWRELGVPWEWSLEEYGRKLLIGGGKERMSSLFAEPAFLAAVNPPNSAAERASMIAEWHKRKTAIYTEIIASGQVPPRSGVKRLCEEALHGGWALAVASTSAREAVETVLRHAVGETIFTQFTAILAGDVVKAKKPAPDIYQLAAQRLETAPDHCVAVEDSRNGLLAAKRAGMHCLVTVSSYTRQEAFAEADLVLTCLGDPSGETCGVIANRSAANPRQFVTADDLEQLLAGVASPGRPSAAWRR